MLRFLRNLFRPEDRLTQGPYSGRPRSWTADSGYVYEYAFAGFRRIRQGGEDLIEYRFAVTFGKPQGVTIAVFLPESRLPAWTGTARELTASERYGIAKLCLKAEFDRAESPAQLLETLRPAEEQIGEIARTLDL